MIPWASFQSLGREREYLLDAFDPGRASGGKYVKLLDKEMSIYPKHLALCVSSDYFGLTISYAIGRRKGVNDEVLVPEFCYQVAANGRVNNWVLDLYFAIFTL